MKKVKVCIVPKKGLLDPEGAAVEHATEHLDYIQCSGFKMGKIIEFFVNDSDPGDLEKNINRLCHELLSNPVIEDYHYEILNV